MIMMDKKIMVVAVDITEVPYNWEEVTDQNGKVVAYKQVPIPVSTVKA